MAEPLGAPIRVKEHGRFVTGAGRYVDDIRVPGALHAAFVRSPHAHARVGRVDGRAAAAMPGVAAVYTARDLPGAERPIPASIAAPSGFRRGGVPALAGTETRYVGEPVAVVLAESPYLAADAAAAVAVDWKPRPAAGTLARALAADAPRVFDDWADNVAGVSSAAVGDAERALAAAHLVVDATLGLGRLAAVPIEPRGIVVVPDGPDGVLTVYTCTQSPFSFRAAIASVLDCPEERVRVVAPDTGGGFGVKGHVYSEELVLPLAARRLGRPVRWTETRREHMTVTSADRDQEHRARLGVDGEGRITAVETTFHRDHGVYLCLGEVIARNTINHLPGPYRVPALRASGTNVVSHKAFAGAYRGSGRPEAVFVMERLLDRAARALRLDPAEIRRRNFIRPEAMPFATGLAYRDGTPIAYDPADYPAAFDRLLRLFDYEGWRARQAARRDGARRLGVGLAAYVQGTGVGPFEGADVRVDAAGRVQVRIGVSSQGQSHETTLAQLAARELGVDPDRVTVLGGDTSALAYGMGTGGSRVAANAGPAVARSARQVAAKARRVAAELLECAPEDVALAEGRVHVAGVPERGLALGEVAGAAVRSRSLAKEGSPGLQVCGYFSPDTVTFAFGAQAVAVEVDTDTGVVRVLRHAAVHDCGRPINEAVVEGQLQGGMVQGLGHALGEELAYDADGQLLTGSLMDYALPVAGDTPPTDVTVLAWPSARNELGIKGVGESGIIPVAAAVANAVEDALADLGVSIGRVPLTPYRLWQALDAASRH